MIIPKLKRIKVSSERELRTRLAKAPDARKSVMIVTCNKTSRDKFISTEQVRSAAEDHGWQAGRSYTLIGNLAGHVLRQT